MSGHKKWSEVRRERYSVWEHEFGVMTDFEGHPHLFASVDDAKAAFERILELNRNQHVEWEKADDSNYWIANVLDPEFNGQNFATFYRNVHAVKLEVPYVE